MSVKKRIFSTAMLCLLLMTVTQLISQKAHAATIDFINFNAVMSTSVDPRTGNDVISLLADSSLYGVGGFAGGGFQFQGSSTVDTGIWLARPADPLSPPPDDNTPVLSFLLDADGIIVEISGPDPVPFRLFLATPPPDDTMPGAGPTLIGELDFSGVSGYQGSLNLSGLQVLAVDTAGVPTGEVYDVSPFIVQSVPLPPALLLMVMGVAGLIAVGKKLEQ